MFVECNSGDTKAIQRQRISVQNTELQAFPMLQCSPWGLSECYVLDAPFFPIISPTSSHLLAVCPGERG